MLIDSVNLSQSAFLGCFVCYCFGSTVFYSVFDCFVLFPYLELAFSVFNFAVTFPIPPGFPRFAYP